MNKHCKRDYKIYVNNVLNKKVKSQQQQNNKANIILRAWAGNKTQDLLHRRYHSATKSTEHNDCSLAIKLF